MTIFQAVVLFWWLALGLTGHLCWWAAFCNQYRLVCRPPFRLDPEFWVTAPILMAGGLISLGFAVCFEPGKDNVRPHRNRI
jgi:hypothetical protein